MSRDRLSFKTFQNIWLSLSNRVGGQRRAGVISGCISLLILFSVCCCCLSLFAPASSSVATLTLEATATNIKPTPTLIQLTETRIVTPSLIAPTETKTPPTITNTTTPTNTKTPIATAAKTQSPTPSAASAFKVLLLTSPVQIGGNARVRIQTAPGASCYLSYTTPSGTDSQAKGLGSTVADSNGICTWTWKISPSTKAGTGGLSITANDTTQSFDIIIK